MASTTISLQKYIQFWTLQSFTHRSSKGNTVTEVLGSEIQHAGLDVQFRNKIFYSLNYSKMYQQGGVDKDLGKGGQSFTQRIRQEEAQCFCFPLDLQDSAWSVKAPGDFFFVFFFCHVACGFLILQPGIKTVFPSLQGGFLTTGPPGKSHAWWFLHSFHQQLLNQVSVEQWGISFERTAMSFWGLSWVREERYWTSNYYYQWRSTRC